MKRTIFIIISIVVLFFIILPLLQMLAIRGGKPAPESRELNLEIEYDDDNKIFYIKNKDNFDYIGFNLFLNDNPWYNIQIDIIRAGENIQIYFDELKTREGISFIGADTYIFSLETGVENFGERGEIKDYRIK
jgi:hypothetical protein